ncbi:MAG: ABC transporter permease [Alphaproteobacteria bacterium]|jgi:peptide/nickel transport system permease protein|nr:ABC transporter permease [Alphaproteobacteria bacterium]
MLRFLVRRILLVVPVLFGLLVLTFVLIRVVPNDPSAALAGENATVEQIERIRKEYGFDQPLTTQFFIYLRQVVQADLGTSVYTNRPVTYDLFRRLPATIELTFSALLFATLVGIPLGVLAAVWHNSPVDHLMRVFTVAGLAMATFWLAIMLQLLFSMELDVMPLRGRLGVATDTPPELTGLFLVDSLLAGRLDIFVDALWHLTMPSITLALGAMATITRFTRSGMLETLQSDFVIYETAVGYPRFVLIAVYVLRNSVVAAVTQIGLLFGALIGGAVVVEAIFDWPGIGSYAVEAILDSDYKAILAVTLLIGVVYAVVNIIVDVVHAWIDPRVGEQL